MRSKIIFDGCMEVFEDGTVYKIKNGVKSKAITTSIITHGRSYKLISLYVCGKQKRYYVHKLVAEAFVPNPENKTRVSFKDGNSDNINAENLEWVTPKELVEKSKDLLRATYEKKLKPCSRCGCSTIRADGVCVTCRKEEKIKDKQKDREVDIQNLYGHIDTSRLSPKEKEVVDLRLKNLTLEEIGSIMGCSRQSVDQKLKNALYKDKVGYTPRNPAVNCLDTLNIRLQKKKAKLISLENSIELIAEEISGLESLIKVLKAQMIRKEAPHDNMQHMPITQPLPGAEP